MKRIRGSRGEEDRGAILILALFFIAVMSVLVTSVLARSTAGLGDVVIQRDFLTKRYAAEAGLEAGVQAIRSRTNLCSTGATSTINLTGFLSSNGSAAQPNSTLPPVTVTCTVTSADDVGLGGWGLITRDLDVAEGVEVFGAAGATLRVNGPIFLSDYDDPMRLSVSEGDVVIRTDGSCPIAGTTGPGTIDLSVEPFYTLTCRPTSAAAPAPILTLPTAALPARSGPARVYNSSRCRVWLPGRYTSLPLTDNNYFASGVYYFQDVNLEVRQGSLIGGAAATDEAKLSSATCNKPNGSPVTDADVDGVNGYVPNGTGVKLILGGTSSLVAENPQGVVELFSRRAATGAAGEGTQRVSVMTVDDSVPTTTPFTYLRSTRDFGETRLGVANTNSGGGGGGGGSTIEMVVHGASYVPYGRVNIRNASTKTLFQGGLLAGRLAISTSNNVGGFNIGIRSTPRPRDIVITSTAGPASERQVVAQAKVRIDATQPVGTDLTISSRTVE